MYQTQFFFLNCDFSCEIKTMYQTKFFLQSWIQIRIKVPTSILKKITKPKQKMKTRTKQALRDQVEGLVAVDATTLGWRVTTSPIKEGGAKWLTIGARGLWSCVRQWQRESGPKGGWDRWSGWPVVDAAARPLIWARFWTDQSFGLEMVVQCQGVGAVVAVWGWITVVLSGF